MGIIVYESPRYSGAERYGTDQVEKKTDWCPSICKGRNKKFSVKGAEHTNGKADDGLLLYTKIRDKSLFDWFLLRFKAE